MQLPPLMASLTAHHRSEQIINPLPTLQPAAPVYYCLVLQCWRYEYLSHQQRRIASMSNDGCCSVAGCCSVPTSILSYVVTNSRRTSFNQSFVWIITVPISSHRDNYCFLPFTIANCLSSIIHHCKFTILYQSPLHFQLSQGWFE